MRAEEAEAQVLVAVSGLAQPDDSIREAREKLRRRLHAPVSSVANRERASLEQRIENLRKQHEWGDITDNTYRAARADIEAQLAELPANDKLNKFDRKREILLSMAENMERATPATLQALLPELVERVETANLNSSRDVPTHGGRHLGLIFLAPTSVCHGVRPRV